MFKFVVLCSALAVANAAYLTATHPAGLQSPAIISQSSDIQRGQGGFTHVPNYQRPFDASYYNQRKFENPNESYEQAASIVYDHPPPSASQIRVPSAGVYPSVGVYPSASGAYPSASGAYPSASGAYPLASGYSGLTYNADRPAYTAASASALAQTVSFAAAQGHPITHTVTYTPTYADQSVGTSRESEIRSHAGNRAVTHYTKAVDTAFSSVRKSDGRVTNDAKISGTAPALTYTTSSAAYTSPLVTKANYATPGVLSYSNAPTVAHATFAGHGARYNW